MGDLQPTNWQRERLIGSETLGSVCAARNRENGAILAVRDIELSPDGPNFAERLRQLEQVANHLYIFMEYVHPGSINEFSGQLFSELRVRHFTRHILSGLAYLHGNNIVHRNIRGANLLVDEAGVVKLADFGIAKHFTGPVTNLPMRLNAYWMVPEVAAIFKILRSTPPMPETLSLEGKNFLKFCFQRNPEERPSAAMLLDHPFVRNATDVVSG